ncbi:MAG: ABC transporter ATP-binding protein [Pirellulales bacterium]
MNNTLSQSSPSTFDASDRAVPRSDGPISTVAQVAQAALQEPVAGPAHLAARGLLKSYRKGPIGIPVLQGIELEVREGEFLAIIGQSGCGKSTLLHLLGTLDQPDAGEVVFEGHRIDNLPQSARDILRNRHFGMIFQFYHLLPELTALENVLTPAYIAEGILGYWRRRKEYRQRATELLSLVGLEHRLNHRPREMSGGEMQRAAIARALLARPRVLFADEPTGNLDRASGEHIMQILRRLNEQQKLTIVMVTHDAWIAQQSDRVVSLVEGRIV